MRFQFVLDQSNCTRLVEMETIRELIVIVFIWHFRYMRIGLVGKIFRYFQENNMADKENENEKRAENVASTSKYAMGLDSVARERYERKLELFSGGFKVPDPFAMKESEWSLDMTKWPPVEYADLFNYFINTPGIYTKESLKAYKSLDGYDYFVSGHVHEVFISEISPDSPVTLLKARVKPSQRLNDEPHDVWICVNKLSGYIIAAHCTCKAG